MQTKCLSYFSSLIHPHPRAWHIVHTISAYLMNKWLLETNMNIFICALGSYISKLLVVSLFLISGQYNVLYKSMLKHYKIHYVIPDILFYKLVRFRVFQKIYILSSFVNTVLFRKYVLTDSLSCPRPYS